MSSSKSPALEAKRKRKQSPGTPPESLSKKPRGCASTPTTPKQKQLSMDTFLVRHQSSPLSNIGNSIRPRELIPSRTVKTSSIVPVDDKRDDCQVDEPTSSQSSGKLHLSRNELIKAARLAVGGFYEGQTKERDVEIILEEGIRRSVISEGYALLFHKEVQETHHKFSLLLTAGNVTPSRYPGAAVLHSILENIIPRAQSFDVKSLAFDNLYEVLEKHPPDSDEMRDVYWSILPNTLANSDPSSRWENLRRHLENLDRDTATLEVADLSEEGPVSFGEDEALLQYYITVLEKDFHFWLERHGKDYNTQLVEKKDVPMAATVFWPHEALGTLSKNIKELVLFHKNALVQQNERMLSVTSSLLDMLVEITRLIETPLPAKVRAAGPKLRLLASAVSEILYRSEESVDLAFLFATFKDTLFKLELSKAFLAIYEPRRGKLFTLRDILEAYLRLGEVQNATDLTAAFENLSRNGQICLVSLVQSYLSCFHVSRLWNLIRKSRRTSGFEVSEEEDRYFSSSYSAANLVNDLRTLQNVVKLGTGSKVISIVFHM